jgi:hypothetical protein
MLLIVKRQCGLAYSSWRRGNGVAHGERVVRDRARVQARVGPARDERGARLKNEAMQRTEQLFASLDSLSTVDACGHLTCGLLCL